MGEFWTPLTGHEIDGTSAGNSAGGAMAIAALQSEGSLGNVSSEDRVHRAELARQLRTLPAEALPNIRHFQTQVGCLNRCSFCSQHAGTTVWNMPRQALANLIAALKIVTLEQAVSARLVPADPLNADGVFADGFIMPQAGLLGASRKDRPGVVYCYLDNDPAAYPYLDLMIQWLWQDLGVKVRIATVGYSRRNSALQQMHQRIADTLTEGIAGLRLSFSPYTYGWTSAAQAAGVASRDEFEHDTATMLHTYRTLFLSDRKGRKGASVELRFKPLVRVQEVDLDVVAGRVVIRCGSYLAVQLKPDEHPEFATITDPRGHRCTLDSRGSPCVVYRGLGELLDSHMDEIVDVTVAGQPWRGHGVSSYTGVLHRLQNDDGSYFAIDAERTDKGDYSKFFYPKTPTRPNAGMIDSERYHLNALLEAKRTGIDRTWDDVEQVIRRLEGESQRLRDFDPAAATYIEREVVGLIRSYVRILQLADYPSESYFDKDLSVDTGHICNLGRAFSEYRGIASRPDLPLTPKHERAFGTDGELAEEGNVWRIAITPQDQRRSARGGRNVFRDQPSIVFERLNLANTATAAGQSEERHFIGFPAADRLSSDDTRWFPVIPGHLSKEKNG
jgi:hypothetical protein